jgi:hypothetical protein
MKAKVMKAFPGVPDGENQVRQINEGEVITGDLAAVAVREKWAEEIAEELFDDADGKAKPADHGKGSKKAK